MEIAAQNDERLTVIGEFRGKPEEIVLQAGDGIHRKLLRIENDSFSNHASGAS